MKTMMLAVVLSLAMPLAAQSGAAAEVRNAVMAFYTAFNSHGWDKATEFTTEDWHHINPFGGRTRGRAATLAELRLVHSTFLKGVTDTVESLDVRFATADVAIATAISRVSPYTTPDGTMHRDQRQIRTFILVHRAGRWRIQQDHNTIIAP